VHAKVAARKTAQNARVHALADTRPLTVLIPDDVQSPIS
jgi:hypothetical protein